MSCHNYGEGKIILTMPYDSKGIFLKRPNRFLGKVLINGKEELVHIHDPGRLSELLYEGNEVLLKEYNSKKRKTKWELIGAKYKGNWIFTNSKFHRVISERILKDTEISPFGKVDEIRAEVRVGKSRIDYLLTKNGKRIWVEVKGCTLEENDIALFPDAPTERGRKHVEELKKLIEKGDNSALLILVFHPYVKCFAPNEKRDEKFAESYWNAINKGLKVHPALLQYDGKNIIFKGYTSLCKNIHKG